MLVCVAWPAPASARDGAGLYEPFPAPVSKERAKRFLERLPGGREGLQSQLSLTRGELERGVFVAAAKRDTALDPLSAPLEPGPASARADASSKFMGNAAGVLVPIALVGGLTLLALLATRRAWPAIVGLLVALAAAAALGGGEAPRAQPASPAPLPADFFGIVSDDVYAHGPRYRERVLGQQREAGIGVMRQVFDWAAIERTPGRYTFARHDRYVIDLARQGMRAMPIVFNPPEFRSSAPARGRRPGTYPPREPAAMGRFAAALVRRYGPRGTLWQRRPEIGPLPIRSWQVWNEPNLPAYWPAGPDATEYTRLLRATSAAIKRADPAAEVVSAGLPNSRLGVPLDRYVADMYRAGAGGSFDALAIHPYSREPKGVLTALASTRNVMDRHGDRGPIWVTEFGWADAGPESPFTVGAAGQAARIRRTVEDLVAERRRLGLRGLIYYNWRDAEPYANRSDFFGYHTGLTTIDGRPKPALRAFSRATRGR